VGKHNTGVELLATAPKIYKSNKNISTSFSIFDNEIYLFDKGKDLPFLT